MTVTNQNLIQEKIKRRLLSSAKRRRGGIQLRAVWQKLTGVLEEEAVLLYRPEYTLRKTRKKLKYPIFNPQN
jgi:hypothetical protein